MAPRALRLASAQTIADPPRIVATDLEARLGTRYSIDTVRKLRRRFPRARFVWLMGADSFAELPRWRRWRQFTTQLPIAVHARPDRSAPAAALAGRAARVLRAARLPPCAAPRLAATQPPAWLFLPLATPPISATALRAAGLGLKPASGPARRA